MQFEYKITRHASDEFNELVYVCSSNGQCSIERVPGDQVERIHGILNQQGLEGWELVQVSFGKDGVIIFWKRKVGGISEVEVG